MKIERFRIQGYRSLHDVEFFPRDFSVLVGPNNAGKSNLGASFSLLADTYARGLKLAIEALGGFDAVAWRWSGEAATSVGFEVEASLPLTTVRRRVAGRNSTNGQDLGLVAYDRDRQFVVRHAFSIVGQRGQTITEFAIDTEQIKVCERLGNHCVELLRGNRLAEPAVFEFELDPVASPEVVDLLLTLPASATGRDQGMSRIGTSQPQLAISGFQFFSPIVNAYLDEMMRVRLFNVIPSTGRLPGAPIADGEMFAAGFNLPTLAAYLHDKQPDAWDQVRQAMFRIVPDLDDIQVDRDSFGSLMLGFVDSEGGQTWTTQHVSDGTIRSLAILMVVFDPRHPFVLVEEPENSIHPWALRVFVDACRQATGASSQKQVMLTTHSPVVIDSVHPDDVFVVWREDGRTMLRSLTELDPEVLAMWEAGEIDIFGQIDSGWIRESVPGGVL